MTATLAETRQAFVSGGNAHNVPRRSCQSCGALFFTGLGLNEHARLGWGNGHGSPFTLRTLWRLCLTS